MNRDEALSQIYDYIDGALSPSDRTAFEDAMNADAALRAEVEVEQSFSDILVRRVPRVSMPSEARERLWARISEERMAVFAARSRTEVVKLGWRRFAVAAAVVLGLGISAGFLSDFGRYGVNWSVLAASHHGKQMADIQKLPTEDYAKARQYLVSRIGSSCECMFPDASPEGMLTHAASVEAWENTRLAHLELECAVNGPVSLFVLPSSTFSLTNEPSLQVGSHRYRTATLGCCHALCWQENGEYVCALVGDCKIDGLMAIADRWRSGCRAHAASEANRGVGTVRSTEYIVGR